MRLTKLSLIAAATLATSSLFAAVTADLDGNVVGLNGNVAVGAGSTLTIFNDEAYTFNNKFLAGTVNPQGQAVAGTSGTIVKTGQGTLEIGSYSNINYYYGNSFIGATAPGMLTDANQGALVVKQGTVVVSGYLSQYVEIFPATNPLNNRFLGFNSVELQGSSVLDFSNTPVNVATRYFTNDGAAESGVLPVAQRLNMVNDLSASINSTVITGGDNARILFNTMPGHNGTLGILSGAGQVAFNGAGKMTVTNEADFTGVVYLAGAGLEIAETGSLASASSFNFSYGRGGAYAFNNPAETPAIEEWKPGYVPVNTISGADSVDGSILALKQTLTIKGSQQLNNLQAYFAKSNTFTDIYSAGGTTVTPGGLVYYNPQTTAAINITAGSTLTVNQEMNGYYRGIFVGGGSLVKEGAATLVLMTGDKSNLSSFDIKRGALITTVQGVGSANVNVSAGASLLFVQNTPGDFEATLSGDLGSLLYFQKSSTITDMDGDTIQISYFNVPEIGSVNMLVAQDNFRGTVYIGDGLTMSFNAASGDTFKNASGVHLAAGANGEETRLTFGGSNQTFRNFTGDANTRIELGAGTVTLVQDATVEGELVTGAYSGKIVGIGGFVKSGAGAFVLNGRDELNASTVTYAGATTVKQGSLVLGGVNQLPNTSGLILLGTGKLVADGNQTFGALFGTAGTTLEMGAGTLTIGRTQAETAALAAQVQTPGVAVVPGRYLGTSAVDPVSASGAVYDRNATEAYLTGLLGTGASAADTATIQNLAFAGTITGTGGLIKIGEETLTLTGVNTYTGATQVKGGTLRINGNSIATTSGVTVDAGAALAVNVDSGLSETFNAAITGAGDFSKVGAGELTLGTGVALTGSYRVEEGTLNMTSATGFNGSIAIQGGAVLNYNPVSDLTVGGTITGSGTLIKSGSATLTLTSPLTGFSGNAVVNAGKLVTTGIVTGNVNIASGATYSVNLPAATTYAGVLSGAGTLDVTGSALTLAAASTSFTGTVAVTNTTLVAGTDNMIAGTVALTGSNGAVLDVAATVQNLAGVTGDADAIIRLNGGTLGVSPASGTVVFSGIIEGNGTLVKNGAGTFELDSFSSTSWTGDTVINEGRLVITPAALGDSAVTVNAAGTLALHNPDVVNALEYSQAISGVGTLDKTGAGLVRITDASAGFTGAVTVTSGTLEVVAGALINAGTNVGASIAVSTGGIYQITGTNVSAATAGLVIDSATGQHGSFALSGAHTLTLDAVSYTGNTVLKDGATLDLVTNGLTSISGLAGDTGTVVLTNGSLLVTQNIDGTFLGSFNGLTDLTVTGAGTLTLAQGAVAAVTVDGGSVGLNGSDTTAVTLLNGSTLVVDTSNGGTITSTVNSLYDGTVTGTGNVVKTGANTLVLDAAATAAIGNGGTVGVSQGTLVIEAGSLNAAVTGLTTEGAGTLALNVTSGTQALDRTITGDGALSKIGAGKLVIGTAASPVTLGSTGTFFVREGIIGGNFTTSGGLTIESGATLSPGNSPGVVTVGGNFNLLSGSTLEVEINATTADKVVVNGAANLSGSLLVKQDSTPGSTRAQRGTAYQIVTATGGIAGNFSNADSSGVVQLAAADIAQTGISRVRLTKPDANTLVMTTVTSLASTQGYEAHEGVGGLVSLIDNGMVPAAVLTGVDGVAAGGLTGAVNALSPLGFGSLYAMSSDTSVRQNDRIRERLEQRRYDKAGDSADNYEAFVVGSGAFADNRSKTNTPTFNTRTYGGLVGLDAKVANGLIAGGAIGYDNGTATMHNGGGKVEMSRVRGTAFASTLINKRWFVDGGLSFGYGDFSTTRDTVAGRATGSSTGYDIGANVVTGGIFALNKDLHLTPYLGLAYTHYNFGSFNERGASSALALDSWTNDSLRVSIGSGLGWWIQGADLKWKLGVDVAYHRELLDNESDIDASFISGGSRFSTKAAALPSDALSISPNAALHFDENNSISTGVTFEYGFDGRIYSGLNVTFRRRF